MAGFARLPVGAFALACQIDTAVLGTAANGAAARRYHCQPLHWSCSDIAHQPLGHCRKSISGREDAHGVLAFGAGEIKRLGLLRALWFPGLCNELPGLHDDGRRIGLYPSLRDAIAPNNKRLAQWLHLVLPGGALGYTLSRPFFHATRLAQVSLRTAVQVRALRRIVQEGIAYRGAGLLIAAPQLVQRAPPPYDSTKGLSRSRARGWSYSACAVFRRGVVAVTTAMVPLDVWPALGVGVASLACARDGAQRHGPAHIRSQLVAPMGRFFLPSLVLASMSRRGRCAVGDFVVASVSSHGIPGAAYLAFQGAAEG